MISILMTDTQYVGSRLTNFVGILSQGLRIAPPEAPITGYMVCSASTFLL
jgi:poly [ADP-ribose] polymerase 2/3/4